MSENVDSMVSEAIKKYRGGSKAEARALLEKATELDPNNEKAWMWLSAVVDTPDDQRVCLENVLYLNPNNENAKRGLAILDEQHPRAPEPEPGPEPGPEPADEYAVPTSSASASYDPADQPGSDEYDEWISNMNIGSDTTATEESPFEDEGDAFEDVFASASFDDDDGLFGDESFDDAADSGSIGAGVFMEDADFGDDDMFATESAGEAAVDDDPFGADPFGDTDPFGSTDDVFGASTLMDEDEGLDSFADGGLFVPEAEGAHDTAAGLEADTYFGDPNEIDEQQDPGYFFRAIPKDIKATSLPGQGGGSRIAMLVFVVLLLANAGAVAMLVMG